MALHFLKYAGKIADAKEREDQAALAAVMTDTIIICLATANALNVSLGVPLTCRANDLQDLCDRLVPDVSSNVFDSALTALVKIAGRMAKAIESTDHLEKGNPREILDAEIVSLTAAMLGIVGRLHVPLSDAIQGRWHAVESKSFFRRTIAE